MFTADPENGQQYLTQWSFCSADSHAAIDPHRVRGCSAATICFTRHLQGRHPLCQGLAPGTDLRVAGDRQPEPEQARPAPLPTHHTTRPPSLLQSVSPDRCPILLKPVPAGRTACRKESSRECCMSCGADQCHQSSMTLGIKPRNLFGSISSKKTTLSRSRAWA